MFELISPLDFRYAKGELAERAKRYLSEEAKIAYELKVELAYIEALAELGVCEANIVKEVEEAARNIKAEHVYEEEKITKHETKALVNCLKRRVSGNAKLFIHLGLTSYDVIDTANALRYKDFVQKELIPKLKELESTLIKLALKYKSATQIGRTHGMFAEPITFGFAMAEYVERLGTRILAIEEASSKLCGKIKGAVGAYNSLCLLCDKPEKLEKLTLEKLGLKPARYSTQILPREYFADLMHAVVSTMGILANLADDMRHLQRSEIAEVEEYFAREQVGSSAMPHKRNPVTFENIKSFWKEFVPRMLTVYMDQISEHQRDLSNSASERFLPEILFACYYMSHRAKTAMEKIRVNKNALKRNFENAKEKIIAEPLYILLSLQRIPDAHERVRKALLESDKKELKKLIEKIPKEKRLLLEKPEKYTGLAEEITVEICNYWKEKLKLKG